MADYRLQAYLKASAEKTADNINPAKPISDFMEKNGLVKITKSPSSSKSDSVYRRVAKFLYIIGIDEAAKIITHLTPEQIE